MLELNLIKIFCEVDDFCKEFEKQRKNKSIPKIKGNKKDIGSQKCV